MKKLQENKTRKCIRGVAEGSAGTPRQTRRRRTKRNETRFPARCLLYSRCGLRHAAPRFSTTNPNARVPHLSAADTSQLKKMIRNSCARVNRELAPPQVPNARLLLVHQSRKNPNRISDKEAQNGTRRAHDCKESVYFNEFY